MKAKIPGIMIAGTNSGCGKTTITCAVLQALVDRKLKTGSFKCGPDFIDPMFHSRITKGTCSNLDSFLFDENTLKYLYADNSADKDINIIEGVMGFYDGAGLDSTAASSYEVSGIIGCPVVLCMNARGASLSVLAALQGFLNFERENNIRGVIFNQCTEMTYKALKKAVEDRFNGRVKPLGFMPVMKDCSLESRHLGLVTAKEVKDLKEKLTMLSCQAERSIDIDGLLMLAEEGQEITYDDVVFQIIQKPVRIAVAEDKAFCFYYNDSLKLLSRMGAELVKFSPLTDEKLPDDIRGLYLGGGYPELYKEQLSENLSMLESVGNALKSGLPCIAECGGFMYLTEAVGDRKMTGVISGKSFDTGKLCRFGYITLKALKDNMLCSKDESIRAHEFHHWDCDDPGDSMEAVKKNGRSWRAVHTSEYLYAGYPHFNFYSNPAFAENFLKACSEYEYR